MPHIYGSNDVFPDYEWFQFLKIISDKTDYEWYIKSHRDYLQKHRILRDFAKDNSKFHVIPPDTSHFQIVKEGINCYSLWNNWLGVCLFWYSSINATPDNPHMLYDFNLHAKNIKEYEHMVLNFEKYEINYIKIALKNLFNAQYY